MKRNCADSYQNDFEQLTCYLAETFARMDALGSALGALDSSLKLKPTLQDFKRCLMYVTGGQVDRKSMGAVVFIAWLLLTPKGNSMSNRTH